MKRYIKYAFLSVFIFILSITLLSCVGSARSDFKVVFVVDREHYYTVEASENEVITLPDAPTKSEHVFDGWFIDSGKWSIPFDENYFIGKEYSTDLYVYAKFTYLHVHTEGDKIISSKPTCLEEGEAITKCINCDEILKSEAVPPLPHTEVIVEGIEATETKDGLTDGSYCSVCNTIVTSQKLIPAEIQGTKLKSELFEINGDSLSLVLPNSAEEISITENLKFNYKATVSISYDEAGEVPAEDSVLLAEGDNRLYITVTNRDEAKTYELNVYRRPLYTLTFIGDSDEPIGEIKVEEGSPATAPELSASKPGYTFNGWNYDFTLPVTESKSVTATWIPNEDTPYTVEYYVKNPDGSFSLFDTKSLAGLTDSEVTAEIIDIKNHAYAKDLSTHTGNILPDGSLVLKMYYERVAATVKFNTGCNEKLDEVTLALNSKLDEPEALTFGDRIFMGWYLGEEKWNFDTDTVAEDITLLAKWGYTVTFMLDGEETSILVEEGKTIKKSDPPKKSGALIKWHTLETDEVWNYNTPVTKHLTLVAECFPITEPDLT